MKFKSYSTLHLRFIVIVILIAVFIGMIILFNTISNISTNSDANVTDDKIHEQTGHVAIKPISGIERNKLNYIDEDFNDIYILEEKDILKYVPQPFSDERINYFVNEHGFSSKDNIESATFWWENDTLYLKSVQVGFTPTQRTLEQVLRRSIDIPFYKIDNWDSVPRIPLDGDWIIREGTTTDQQLDALTSCIQEHTNIPITFNKKQVTKEVLNAYGLNNKKPTSNKKYIVSVYINEISTRKSEGGGTGKTSEFLHSLSKFLNIPIISEIKESHDPIISWKYYLAKDEIPENTLNNPVIEKILFNISNQLPIEFKKETREINVWTIK